MNATHPPLAALAGLPRDAEGPVFEQPWQAQVFAMTVSLHERGVFTWPEWSNALAQQICAAAHHDEPHSGESYYGHWLRALEALLAARGVASIQELSRCEDAWRRGAYSARSPHRFDGRRSLAERGSRRPAIDPLSTHRAIREDRWLLDLGMAHDAGDRPDG
jgi:nitrile hydratase accessory protein